MLNKYSSYGIHINNDHPSDIRINWQLTSGQIEDVALQVGGGVRPGQVAESDVVHAGVREIDIRAPSVALLHRL